MYFCFVQLWQHMTIMKREEQMKIILLYQLQLFSTGYNLCKSWRLIFMLSGLKLFWPWVGSAGIVSQSFILTMYHVSFVFFRFIFKLDFRPRKTCKMNYTPFPQEREYDMTIHGSVHILVQNVWSSILTMMRKLHLQLFKTFQNFSGLFSLNYMVFINCVMFLFV